jgi:uncharacterized membrane protein
MFDIISALLSLIMLFFLPGFLLVLVLFPQKGALNSEYDLLFKGVIGIIFSMVISIFVGIVLYGIANIEAPPEVQMVRLWIVLTLISAFLIVLAWRRGALHDILPRRSAPDKNISTDEEINRLTAEKRKLQDKIEMMSGEEYKTDKALMEEAALRMPVLQKQVADLNKRIDELIEKEERAGG